MQSPRSFQSRRTPAPPTTFKPRLLCLLTLWLVHAGHSIVVFLRHKVKRTERTRNHKWQLANPDTEHPVMLGNPLHTDQTSLAWDEGRQGFLIWEGRVLRDEVISKSYHVRILFGKSPEFKQPDVSVYHIRWNIPLQLSSHSLLPMHIITPSGASLSGIGPFTQNDLAHFNSILPTA